ncbi:hypothetical protein DXG01_008045 [Tephrocybe rancida]|nr:hypothetical protein DXG01_008045 [Tephrocybe rancida]
MLSVALLREVYTTTVDSRGGRCVRLQQGKSPIADFGVAKGMATTVKSHNKLAYLYSTEGTFVHGQDPNEHSWLYSKDINGHNTILDDGFFSLDFCCYTIGDPYSDSIGTSVPHSSAPACYLDPDMIRRVPKMNSLKKKFSVLVNKDLQRAVSSPETDWTSIYWFMDSMSGNKNPAVDNALAKFASTDCCKSMAKLIERRAYEAWPDTPGIYFEGSDPKDLPAEDNERREYMASGFGTLSRQKYSGRIQ